MHGVSYWENVEEFLFCSPYVNIENEETKLWFRACANDMKFRLAKKNDGKFKGCGGVLGFDFFPRKGEAETYILPCVFASYFNGQSHFSDFESRQNDYLLGTRVVCNFRRAVVKAFATYENRKTKMQEYVLKSGISRIGAKVSNCARIKDRFLQTELLIATAHVSDRKSATFPAAKSSSNTIVPAIFISEVRPGGVYVLGGRFHHEINSRFSSDDVQYKHMHRRSYGEIEANVVRKLTDGSEISLRIAYADGDQEGLHGALAFCRQF
jgi:hypothetical protein